MIKKHIPNCITCLNLASGILGIIAAMKGCPAAAFALMIAASVFDFCDGLAARFLKAYSDMGKELDSLSDMVSFGVLPALLLSQCMQLGGVTGWVSYLPLVLAVFSGLRLAKFNVDTRQESDFLGLATPSSALLSAALACYVFLTPDSFLTGLCRSVWFLPLVAAMLSALLVSEIPMFGMKIKKGQKLLDTKRIVFLVLAAAAIVCTIVLHRHFSLAVLLVFSIYILENLLYRIFAR